MRGLFVIATCDVQDSVEPLRAACAARWPEFQFTTRDDQVCVGDKAKPITVEAIDSARLFARGFLSGYPAGYGHGVEAGRR